MLINNRSVKMFKSSGKAVSPKAGNIRNTEKPIQTFTVTKTTIRVKDLKSVLGFCVTSFCACCSFRSENQHLWGRISTSLFSYYVKLKAYLQDILSHVSYSRQGKQHATLIGVTKKLKYTVWKTHSVLTDPIRRVLSLHEPKVCHFSQPLPRRIHPDREVKLVLIFQKQQQLFYLCVLKTHVINCSVRFS
jgi:hypothetical protein